MTAHNGSAAGSSVRHGVMVGGLAIVAAMVSVNTGAAFAKTLFPLAGPFGITALRIGFASLLLMAVRRPWRHLVARRHIGVLVAYGAALGVMNALFYQAFARIPVGIAVAIEVTGPLTVALLGSRRLSDIVWLAMAVAGLVILSPMRASAPLDPVGVAFALGAAVCWALYIVFGKRASATIGGDAVAWGMVVAALLMVPAGIFVGGRALFTAPVLVGGLVVAALSSALPYSLEMEALRRLPAHVFGLMVSAAPAVATLAAFAILGERISPMQWLAIMLITAASAGSAAVAGTRTGAA